MRQKSHPLEDVFDLPKEDIEETEDMLPVAVDENLPAIVEEQDPYDDKDKEIESQFQNVYDKAIEVFEHESDAIAHTDPRFKARRSEIAVQYLNTALSAAKEKQNLKKHKDEMGTKSAILDGPTMVNDNLVLDRNVLLRGLLDIAKDAAKDVSKNAEKVINNADE